MNILKFGLSDNLRNTNARFATFLAQWKGRISGQTAGTFVNEMAGLEKMLYLCDGCIGKFNAKRAGYRRPSRPPLNKGCISNCDGCREWGDCNILLPEGRY